MVPVVFCGGKCNGMGGLCMNLRVLVGPCQPPFVLTGPHSYLLPLVCACLHYFSGPCLSLLVYPHSVVLGQPLFVLASTHLCWSPCFCWSLFVPAHLSLLGCTGWPSHSSLLVCTLRCLFVLISICLLVPICPCWFVPTQLYWLALVLITACLLI